MLEVWARRVANLETLSDCSSGRGKKTARRKMRRLPVVLVWSFGAVGGVAPSIVAQEPVHDELSRLTREMFETMIVHRDPNLFDTVALPEVLVIPPGGLVETKAQAIRGIRSFAVRGIKVSGIQTVESGSTAVVIGTLLLDGSVRGREQVQPLRFLNIFVRVGEDWRLLARSLTPCAEEAVAAGRC